MQFFRAVGADVVPRIPHRVDEGYGLNAPALTGWPRSVGWLSRWIAVSATWRKRLATELGTGLDRDRPPPATGDLPTACAILNVRQPGDEYPDKGLAGVGVAFHLVRALSQVGPQADHSPTSPRPARPGSPRHGVRYCAPDRREPGAGSNRPEIAQHYERPGILALIEAASLTPGQLDTASIGFGLAPRINAAGRIDDAIIAYELLLTDDLERARQLAQELTAKNSERQQKLAVVLAEARAQVYRDRLHEQHKLMVLSGEEWAAGIVGLVAGRLADEFNRPVLVLERGQQTSKGSARSIPQFNIIEAISDCHDLLLRYGGHKQAAGFTLNTDQLDEFTSRLQALADHKLQPAMLIPQLEIDAELSLDGLAGARQAGATLEPFGSENPAPVFVSRRLNLREVRPVGADGAHLQLKLFDPDLGRTVQAIAFRAGPRLSELTQARSLDIVYVLEDHEWQGQRRLQLRLIDFRVSV